MNGEQGQIVYADRGTVLLSIVAVLAFIAFVVWLFWGPRAHADVVQKVWVTPGCCCGAQAAPPIASPPAPKVGATAAPVSAMPVIAPPAYLRRAAPAIAVDLARVDPAWQVSGQPMTWAAREFVIPAAGAAPRVRAPVVVVDEPPAWPLALLGSAAVLGLAWARRG